MSIKIHHGPPGSYKTSGAVMDDFIPAVRAGRKIVTNVRGLDDRQLIVDTLGSEKNPIPDSFDIHWVDTTTQSGRDSLSTFFHWVPKGTFLLIDEAQMVFPLAWRDTDLKKLDYPGGLVAASKDDKPPNFLLAFEMHRHYGWDMVLTTPNISKIRGDIRGCCEGAYKHKNQALIGLKGRYLEAFHMAEDNGKSESDFLSVRGRKIKKEVWGLYASTTTGTHTDTIAGSPLWKNPKVALLVVILAVALFSAFYRKPPAIIASAIGSAPASSGAVAVPGAGSAPPVSISGHVPISQVSPVFPSVDVMLDSPFFGYKFRIFSSFTANGKTVTHFEITNDDEILVLSDLELARYGYQVHVYDACHLDVYYQDVKKPFPVRCSKQKQINETPISTLAKL